MSSIGNRLNRRSSRDISSYRAVRCSKGIRKRRRLRIEGLFSCAIPWTGRFRISIMRGDPEGFRCGMSPWRRSSRAWIIQWHALSRQIRSTLLAPWRNTGSSARWKKRHWICGAWPRNWAWKRRRCLTPIGPRGRTFSWPIPCSMNSNRGILSTISYGEPPVIGA